MIQAARRLQSLHPDVDIAIDLMVSNDGVAMRLQPSESRVKQDWTRRFSTRQNQRKHARSGSVCVSENFVSAFAILSI